LDNYIRNNNNWRRSVNRNVNENKMSKERFNIDKAKSRLIPNTPTPKQIQDQLDRARQIPKKQEVRRCRKQGRLGK